MTRRRKRYEPPLTITLPMLQSVADICEQMGRWSSSVGAQLSPHLRRKNRIRTVQASLAIEHNTLSVEQVTAVLAGKRVIGKPREIQEVRNAFLAYEAISRWRPESRADLLAAHALLMSGLVDDPGTIRDGGVGIYHGKKLVHMAPPPSRVSTLLDALLHWVATTETHPLITSSVFHYEFEFIHPFMDGNGRMGRLWQTLILSHWQPMLAYLPVETVIRDRQEDYYQALSAADKAGASTPFVEFMLDALYVSIREAVAWQRSEKSSEKSSEKILAILRAQPDLAAKDVAKKLKLTARSVEKNIALLREQGRLRRIGPAKGGYWKVD